MLKTGGVLFSKDNIFDFEQRDDETQTLVRTKQKI